MIFFTADTHFGHNNIISKMDRTGFSTIEEHDNHLISQINKYVHKDDTLYILGDFAWKRPQKYRPKIICRNVHLILGNHDKAFASSIVFGDMHHIKIIKLYTKEKAVLCHYPIAYWPASHYNAYHLYGHMHAKREETLDRLFPDRRSMDVGMDNAYRLLGEYRPFSEHDITNLLAHKIGHDPVSYYRESRMSDDV